MARAAPRTTPDHHYRSPGTTTGDDTADGHGAPRPVTVGVGAPLYPVGLVVAGRPCLVVGGGRVAGGKIRGLLACGAAVTVVAPQVHDAVEYLVEEGAVAAIDGAPLQIELRPYAPGEAARFELVIAATGDAEVDDAVHRDATGAGVWVNVADHAAHCTFVLPALARDGAVTVAVSTGGASPALATWLRDRVVDLMGPGVGELADMLGEARRQVHERGATTEALEWRSLLDGPLTALVRAGRLDEARATLDAFVADAPLTPRSRRRRAPVEPAAHADDSPPEQPSA